MDAQVQRRFSAAEWDVEQASLLVADRVPLHFVGVGGIGMAGLAHLLHGEGISVTGCDLQTGRLMDWLSERSLPVVVGHEAAHIDDSVGALVFSTAISATHPERLAAEQRELPVLRRGAMLAAWTARKQTCAVTGTHGKTTTSTMLTHILHQLGRAPGFCLGGEVRGLPGGGPSCAGSGSLLIIEADESDGGAALITSEIAVLTNVETDHMEHFADQDELAACLHCFLKQAGDTAWYGIDDAGARSLVRGLSARSFGLSPDSDVRADALEFRPEETCFTVRSGGASARCRLPLNGEHNVRNALAAIAASQSLGCSLGEACEALCNLQNPRRRFEILGEAGGVLVVHDYAHHPTEIHAAIAAARQRRPRRVLVLFQPHRYTRTRALAADFPAAFEQADRVFITPVYAASEAPLPGGTTPDLLKRMPQPKVQEADSCEQAWAQVRTIIEPGDILLVVGAGDVEQWAHRAWADVSGHQIE